MKNRLRLPAVLVICTVFIVLGFSTAAAQDEEITLQEFMDRVIELVLQIQAQVERIAEVAAEKTEVRALETRVAALETAMPRPTATPTPTATPEPDTVKPVWCPTQYKENQYFFVTKPVPNADGEIDPEDELRYLAEIAFYEDAAYLGCTLDILSEKHITVLSLAELIREIATYCEMTPQEVFDTVNRDTRKAYRTNGYLPDTGYIKGKYTFLMMRTTRFREWQNNLEERCP